MYIALLAVFLLLGYLYYYVISNTQKSRRRSLQEVYEDRELMEKYNIVGKKLPSDYGLVYEDVEFTSLDKLLLKGWYIKGGEKAIIISHGRSGNRLNVMEYLKLLKDNNILDRYSVLIYDLRNGGESKKAPTGVGEYFRKDIAGAMKYMKSRGHKTFLMWGYSMGALGTLKAIEDIADEVEVEKVILDSPLSNAKEVLGYSFVKEGHGEFVKNMSVCFYNIHMGFKLKDYSISRLIDKLGIETLMLQSKDDIITPYRYFEEEVAKIGSEKCRVEVFESGKHLYLRRAEPKRYDRIITEFIQGGSSGETE